MRQPAKPSDPQYGGTLYMFVFCMVICFLVLGMSVDLGVSYVGRSSLSKALDAGSLAGARYTAKGSAAMRDRAIQVARANYRDPATPVTYDVQITQPATDAYTVRMAATSGRPTYFSKLAGKTSIAYNSTAAATRHPLDLSIVLDLSHSMYQSGAISDLKEATSDFLEYFDESIDQLGLVTYSTWAEERLAVQKNFRSSAQTIIAGLNTYTDTNIQEGLRISKNQLAAAPQRTTARRAVVLVTDGLPTAYRDTFELLDPFCTQYEGVIAAFITNSLYRGLFDPTDGRKLLPHAASCNPKNYASNTSILPSPLPAYILQGAVQLNLNGNNVRTVAKEKALEQAAAIAAAKYKIYTVVIADPNNANLLSQVLAFADEVVNQQSLVSAGIAPGKVFYAQNNSKIDGVFEDLAGSILAQITE